MQATTARGAASFSTKGLAVVLAAAVVTLQTGAVSAQNSTWTISSLSQTVAPLQHALNERMPLLAQELPEMPTDDSSVTMRSNGTLLTNVETLWSRGIAPSVFIPPAGTINGALATAATLRDAGVPIHLFAQVFATEFWPSAGTEWFTYQNNLSPVYPLASPVGAYNTLLGTLQSLQAGNASAGLPGVSSVSGLWMDYEDHPQPWGGNGNAAQFNGILANGTSAVSYYSSTTVPFPGNGQSVNQVYGSDPNYLAYFETPGWVQYGFDLRTWVLDQSVRLALTNVYGASNPWFGNFGEFFSTPSTPYYDLPGTPYPITRAPVAGTAAMPSPYADNNWLKNFLGGSGQPPITQSNVDDAYWLTMLRTFSTSAQNAGTTGGSVAWVSQYVRDDTSGTYDYPMTVSLYKELLRHIWLRGCMRMSVFNPQDPNADPTKIYMTPDYSFNQLEYARAILDEMLSFRSFLDNGTPMNFAFNPMFDHGPVWSGLALNGQAVVRAVSPNSTTTNTITSIAVPGGSTFTNLAAPPDGATYLLGPGTIQHRVDVRPAAAYLQMSRNFTDSSGNGNNGSVCWKWPSTYPNPTFSFDVPGTSVLQAVYGLNANQNNRYSLTVTRDPSTIYSGNGVCIPNTNNVLNAPSFTFETFIKVAAGMSQDTASIVSKGAGASLGSLDWAITYRDFDGAGMLELDFGLDASTYAYIRTSGAPLTPGAWHHLALTYDGSTRQATVYVDGVAQPLGFHNDQISDTGVLNWDFSEHTGDQLVLGFFSQGINAQYDEARFTPEVLDPDQFLTLGTLQ